MSNGIAPVSRATAGTSGGSTNRMRASRIDEAADQPRAGDAVDLRPPPRDPQARASAAQTGRARLSPRAANRPRPSRHSRRPERWRRCLARADAAAIIWLSSCPALQATTIGLAAVERRQPIRRQLRIAPGAAGNTPDDASYTSRAAHIDDQRRRGGADQTSRVRWVRSKSSRQTCVPSMREGDGAWALRALEGGATVAGPARRSVHDRKSPCNRALPALPPRRVAHSSVPRRFA